MKKYLSILGAGLFVITFLAATPVQAVNIQHFRPSTGSTKGLQVYTTDNLTQGQWAAGLMMNYAQHLLKEQPAGGVPDIQIVDELLMADFLIDIGLTDWWDLHVDLPITAYHNIQASSVSTPDEGGGALGDLQLRTKISVWDAAETENGLGMGFVGAITLPTGQDSVFIGNDGIAGDLNWVGDWQIHSNRFYMNAGYRWRPREVIGVGPGALTVKDEFLYGLGFQRPIYAPWDFDMIIEGYGLVDFGNNTAERGLPLEFLFAGRKGFFDNEMVMQFGGGWGASDGYGTPRFRVFLGLSYVAPPPEQPVEVVEPERIAITEKIHFQFDKAVIRPASYHVLDEVVQVMQNDPSIQLVEIRGYTDAVGSDEYNQRLSERRSQSVKAYLVSKGIAADRLVAKGFGESNPIATNDTAEGRALNRRTDFMIMERN